MRSRIGAILACCGLVLSACSGVSGTSSADACRVLQLAKGASLDLSFQVIRQNPKNLHEFLPPTPDTIAKFKSVESSLTNLADQLGSGDKADLARQFASDLEQQLQVAMQRQVSMESGAALANDASRVIALCGY